MPQLLRFQPAVVAAEASDDALVAASVSDRQAFGLLYDRYVDAVYRYCNGRLRDREAAEDATSLIFARALAALPTHRGGAFRSWLFAIAHNVVINARRDASRDDPLTVVIDLTDPGPSLEELAVTEERQRSVRQ